MFRSGIGPIAKDLRHVIIVGRDVLGRTQSMAMPREAINQDDFSARNERMAQGTSVRFRIP